MNENLNNESKEYNFYTVLEAAAMAAESNQTILNRINAGVIKAIRTRLGYLITPEALNDYLNRRGPKDRQRRYRNEDLMPESNTSTTDDVKNQEREI
ncbi:helix-turn-helix domain-containing protein [Streptomyces scabiei]|uniref:helix-turn-helix domain-containing protein n=1 Tax=Streptomyces scabiei TaxID=1930 RepID=UPI0038F68888